VRRGWNEWAGETADGSANLAKEKRFAQRTSRAEEMRKKKIDELKQKRVDGKLKGV
jgi:hypothetical protein